MLIIIIPELHIDFISLNSSKPVAFCFNITVITFMFCLA